MNFWSYAGIAAAMFFGVGRSSAVVVAGGSLEAALGLAADPSYAAVGWVGIKEGSASYRGTGVLVSPEWVLTAAHNWLSNAVTGLEFHIGGETYTASPGNWLQHPSWMSSPEVAHDQGADIALFRLSRPVTSVAPAGLYGGVAELGALVTIVGAGSAGTLATGPRPNSAPILYAATNVIDRVISTSVVQPGGLLAFDFDDGTAFRNSLSGTAIFNTLGNEVPFSEGLSVVAQSSASALTLLEGTSAAGDSGAPAFADFGNGLEIVGLVSWGVNPTNPSNPYGSGAGDITYLTRVSTFQDWVLATIPEVETAFLLVLASPLFWLRRR